VKVDIAHTPVPRSILRPITYSQCLRGLRQLLGPAARIRRKTSAPFEQMFEVWMERGKHKYRVSFGGSYEQCLANVVAIFSEDARRELEKLALKVLEQEKADTEAKAKANDASEVPNEIPVAANPS